MASETPVEQPQETTKARERGSVKWFNNRSGYGFIKITQGDKENEDIFVHHSALRTSNDQYKYLVQGEYVDFDLVETGENSEHKWQAGNVSGVDMGSLMCETRNSVPRGESSDKVDNNRSRRSFNTKRHRGSTRSFRDDDGVEWMLVKKNAKR